MLLGENFSLSCLKLEEISLYLCREFYFSSVGNSPSQNITLLPLASSQVQEISKTQQILVLSHIYIFV